MTGSVEDITAHFLLSFFRASACRLLLELHQVVAQKTNIMWPCRKRHVLEKGRDPRRRRRGAEDGTAVTPRNSVHLSLHTTRRAPALRILVENLSLISLFAHRVIFVGCVVGGRAIA